MQIQELRKGKGLTQKDLSLAVGVGRSTVAMWETGQSSPRTPEVNKLAKVLGVSVEQVIACFTADAEETA